MEDVSLTTSTEDWPSQSCRGSSTQRHWRSASSTPTQASTSQLMATPRRTTLSTSRHCHLTHRLKPSAYIRTLRSPPTRTRQESFLRMSWHSNQEHLVAVDKLAKRGSPKSPRTLRARSHPHSSCTRSPRGTQSSTRSR